MPRTSKPCRRGRMSSSKARKKLLALGLPLDALPMKRAVDGANLISPREVRPDLHIETNASSELIMQWLSKMLQERKKPKGFLQIVTKSGKTIELPQGAKGEAGGLV